MDPNNNPATAWTAAVSQLQQDIMRQWQQAVSPPAPVNPMLGAWAPFALPGMPPGFGAGLAPNAMSSQLAAMGASVGSSMGSMLSGMLPGGAAPAPSLASPMAAWDQYFKFSQSISEQFKKLPGMGGDPTAQAKEFASAMDGWFRKLGGGNPLLSAFGQLLPRPSGTGATPAANPFAFASGASSSSGDSSASSATTPGDAFQPPALGLLREHQEALQRLAQSAAKLQQLQTDFTGLWTQVGNEAADKFGTAMSARLSGGQSFGSVMEIYNLWVECAEQCYAKVAHSAQYAAILPS